MTITDPQLAPMFAPAAPPGAPPDSDQPAAAQSAAAQPAAAQSAADQPAADQPAAARPPVRWGDTVVGAAVTAEEATTTLIAGLRRATARQAQRVARLADRGAAERARWRQQAERTGRTAVATVATAPIIDRVVDHQLQRVLRPVVFAVLDDVLQLFEKEPERIQMLIRGQRETMVDELIERLRSGAEAGDTAVDRLTFRFRRGRRPDPGPPTEL